ncbi:HAD family hydrolase [Novosphingobium terrae]|jgi:2-haloacid dehalogenase|uniref:HAD family hydrolase n=1 Tax=Novosphingobium terrae TaxID=2726189 RepID=UPI0019812B7B|nr:HAD family phosphatase [Novosphingobium terrae]
MTSQTSTTQPHVVVFDIGHVLTDWDLRRLYEKLIDDPEKLDWFLSHVVTVAWHFEHDAGKPFAQMVAERSALYPDQAELIEAYADRWIESIPGPIPGTPALVDRLAARGVPLYAITNFGVEAFDLFRPTMPQLEHMRDIVVSGEEKMVKPNDDIFHHAAERFGHAPAEMLFVDDNAANIATAQRLGWHTHHFVGGAQALEADLVARGLLEG